MIENISDNEFFVHHKSGDALVQIDNGGRDAAFGTNRVSGLDGLYDHVPWGALDNQPNFMLSMLTKNGQAVATLDAARDLIYGTGLRFKAKDQAGILTDFYDSNLDELAFRHDINGFVINSINQLNYTGNLFARYQKLDPTKTKEWRISTSDGFKTRIGKPSDLGEIRHYVVNPHFGTYNYQHLEGTETVAAFDASNPEANPSSIMHVSLPRPGNDFYSYPSWWCSEQWIEMANMIPIFYLNGIKNGYNIKYLIKMPQDYFDKENGEPLTPKERKAKWDEFGVNFSKWMSGEKNVNKTLIVKYLRGDDGKSLDNIMVETVDNKGADDTYSRVSEMAAKEISNAMGLLPTLGGVNPGKGNDSGSQIRVMAEYQQHFRTSALRSRIFIAIRWWLILNGYPNVYPTIEGVQITTLDVVPTGTQSVNNSSDGNNG